MLRKSTEGRHAVGQDVGGGEERLCGVQSLVPPPQPDTTSFSQQRRRSTTKSTRVLSPNGRGGWTPLRPLMGLQETCVAPGWPQLRSGLPFGPRSQASLQKAQGPGVSKATLWVKAQHEGALPPPCIVRKDPRVPHTNTGVGSLSLLQGIFPTQGSFGLWPHPRGSSRISS